MKIVLFLLGMFLGHSLLADSGIDDVLVLIDGDNTALIARGESVYAAACASCHGKNLEGQTPEWRKRLPNGMLPAPPHDYSGHTWHHADDLLFEITKYGPARVIGDPDYQSMMPAFEEALSDAEIIAVLAFIKSRWGTDERKWQAQLNANSAKEFKLFDSKK